jgi:hypothetical protein
MSRPDRLNSFDATDDTLIHASSSSFSARFFSAVAALTRSTR